MPQASYIGLASWRDFGGGEEKKSIVKQAVQSLCADALGSEEKLFGNKSRSSCSGVAAGGEEVGHCLYPAPQPAACPSCSLCGAQKPFQARKCEIKPQLVVGDGFI